MSETRIVFIRFDIYNVTMDKKIKPRVRLIIIKNNKLLLTYTKDGDFYFYIGGKMEFGETLEQTCLREIKEECGQNVKFTFKKILYIRDYIKPEEDEHSIEFYILGDINKFEEVEGVVDEEFAGLHYQTWVGMDNLPENILPKSLTVTLKDDYKNGFPRQGEYLGSLD